jgi:hypothetical protein
MKYIFHLARSKTASETTQLLSYTVTLDHRVALEKSHINYCWLLYLRSESCVTCAVQRRVRWTDRKLVGTSSNEITRNSVNKGGYIDSNIKALLDMAENYFLFQVINFSSTDAVLHYLC